MPSHVRTLVVLSLPAALLLVPALDRLNEAAPLVPPIVTVPDPLLGPAGLRVEPADYVAEVGPGAAGDRAWQALASFYVARGHQPAWVRDGALSADAELLFRALARAGREGLAPERYGLERIAFLRAAARQSSAGHDTLGELDLLMTSAFVRYASDLLEGRFNPRGASPYWTLRPSEADLAELLCEALATGRFADVLRGLVPEHPQYVGLREALARHRRAAREAWLPMDRDLRLRAGERHPQVHALRTRLQLLGDLPEAPAEATDLFDQSLAQALARFQARHGLKADGRLGESTLRVLDVPLEETVRRIELNMERWRWLPRDLGRRHVLVNVPAFELLAVEDGRVALRTRVVTGKAGESPTPVLMENLTTVVFSPYWNIPPGIMAEETLPAARHSPRYLARNDMEVVRAGRVVHPSEVDWSDPAVRVRQRPGRKNALGGVKFLMPNPYHVYLHDTPAKPLFARPRRDFSHGCVRVQQPADLARFLLPDWTPERIRAAMRAGEERHVALPEAVPVYVAYFTAWVNDDGALRLYPDVYRHDEPQQRLMPAPQVTEAAGEEPAAPAPAAASSL